MGVKYKQVVEGEKAYRLCARQALHPVGAIVLAGNVGVMLSTTVEVALHALGELSLLDSGSCAILSVSIRGRQYACVVVVDACVLLDTLRLAVDGAAVRCHRTTLNHGASADATIGHIARVGGRSEGDLPLGVVSWSDLTRRGHAAAGVECRHFGLDTAAVRGIADRGEYWANSLH